MGMCTHIHSPLALGSELAVCFTLRHRNLYHGLYSDVQQSIVYGPQVTKTLRISNRRSRSIAAISTQSCEMPDAEDVHRAVVEEDEEELEAPELSRLTSIIVLIIVTAVCPTLSMAPFHDVGVDSAE